MFTSEELETIVMQLIAHIEKKQFRTAENFLKNNINNNDPRIAPANILIENLSNMYGDIGELKDECFLRKDLDSKSQTIINLLR